MPGPLPTSSYKRAVYYCSQDIATAFCAVSRDGGTTFGAGVPTYSLLDCGGLHGHVKVAPDGTAYLPNKGCGPTPRSWSTGQRHLVDRAQGPGRTPGDSDPSIGVGSNGTVYFGYVGSDGKPGVAVSRNKGKTWANRQTVGTEFAINNAVFPTVVAGDDDRAAVAFIGTPTGGNYQDTANFHGRMAPLRRHHLRRWQDLGDQRRDAEDPVQRGSICTGGTTCGDDRNLLDFIDVTIETMAGSRSASPTGASRPASPTRSTSAGTLTRRSRGKTSGKPLFSRYDPTSINATLIRCPCRR